MDEWHKAETPPDTDRFVRIGWLTQDGLEYEQISRWMGKNWLEGWTPTHWRELSKTDMQILGDR